MLCVYNMGEYTAEMYIIVKTKCDHAWDLCEYDMYTFTCKYLKITV